MAAANVLDRINTQVEAVYVRDSLCSEVVLVGLLLGSSYPNRQLSRPPEPLS